MKCEQLIFTFSFLKISKKQYELLCWFSLTLWIWYNAEENILITHNLNPNDFFFHFSFTFQCLSTSIHKAVEDKETETEGLSNLPKSYIQ